MAPYLHSTRHSHQKQCSSPPQIPCFKRREPTVFSAPKRRRTDFEFPSINPNPNLQFQFQNCGPASLPTTMPVLTPAPIGARVQNHPRALAPAYLNPAAFVQTSLSPPYPSITTVIKPAPQEIPKTLSSLPANMLLRPPLPLGPPSVAPQNAVSQFLDSARELIASLTAQGILKPIPESQTPADREDDSAPVEFDNAWFKKRHDSVIKSLFDENASDMPRKCATCGRRFKTQDEHSRHMDWHVLKNREAKKKLRRDHGWYLNCQMLHLAWDIMSTPDVGNAFPQSNNREAEKKKEAEVSVPADVDQRECAICGDALEDFYSDETEDWMVRGAVYMNAPDCRSTSGMDRSMLGPIVHANCLAALSRRPRRVSSNPSQ